MCFTEFSNYKMISLSENKGGGCRDSTMLFTSKCPLRKSLPQFQEGGSPMHRQDGVRNKGLKLKELFTIHFVLCPAYFALELFLQLFLFLFVFFQVEVRAAGHRQLLDQSFHLFLLLLLLLHLQLLVLPPVIDHTLWSCQRTTSVTLMMNR